MQLRLKLALLLALLPSLALAQLGTMCTPTCFPAQKIVYTDILNGSDANSGTCQPHQVAGGAWSSCASKTISNALTKFISNGSGGALGLARGTCQRWREQVNVHLIQTAATFNHITIGGYGAGASPLLDASDIITGTDACGISGTYTWTADTGTTWQVSLTSTAEALGWVNFFVNGVGPTIGGVTRATSQANCEATPHTYWPTSDSGGTYTLFYNSGSASNPTTDGNLYEFSSRPTAINDDVGGPRYLTVMNLDARRNHTNNGSIDVGQYSTIINVNANEGTKHNILVADGSVVNGLGMHNAWYGGQGSVLLILFDSFSLGAGISTSNVTASLDVLDTSVTTYYGHFVGPGFGATVPVVNLSATNVGNVLDGPWTTGTNISCTGCFAGVVAYFDGATLNNFTYTSPSAGGGAVNISGPTRLNISNSNITCSVLNQGCLVFTASGASLTMSGTTCENLVAGGCIFVNTGVTMASMAISGSTFLHSNVGGSVISAPNIPTSATFDNNIWHYGTVDGQVRWGGTNYLWKTPANITAWQALGFDAHSTWVNATP